MGQINNYPVGSANATDKILTTDINTGQTKNVTPEGIVSYLGSKYYRAIIDYVGIPQELNINVLGTNTIGNISWSVGEKSTFIGTLVGGFFGNVMFNMCTPVYESILFSIVKDSDDQITLTSSNGQLISQGIEIRIYN
jgi:hypothetical protein